MSVVGKFRREGNGLALLQGAGGGIDAEIVAQVLKQMRAPMHRMPHAGSGTVGEVNFAWGSHPSHPFIYICTRPVVGPGNFDIYRKLPHQWAALAVSTGEALADMERAPMADVERKLLATKAVVADSIGIALANTERLEAAEEQAAQIADASATFRAQSVDLRRAFWWKNLKMKLVIGFSIIALVGTFVGVLIATQKASS